MSIRDESPSLPAAMPASELGALSADDIANRVLTRTANEGRVGSMYFLLKNKAGDERRREALMIHSERGGQVRLGVFFLEPATIEGTGFLSHDNHNGSDENWLYLPAVERVRRLPSSDRADYFMGTDLTYGDVSDDFKFEPDQWQFSRDQSLDENLPDPRYVTLLGTAASNTAIRDNGYSQFTAIVDTGTWFPVVVTYFDAEGDALKTVEVLEQVEIGGAWTAIRFQASNLQSGHTTLIRFENMRYAPDLDERVLEPEELEFGAPVIDQ